MRHLILPLQKIAFVYLFLFYSLPLLYSQTNVDCPPNTNINVFPQNDTFCLGISEPEDIALVSSPPTNDGLVYQFLITQADYLIDGEPVVIGYTTDGAFNFNDYPSGTYHFHPFAYYQQDLDDLFGFMMELILHPYVDPMFLNVDLSLPAKFSAFFNALTESSIPNFTLSLSLSFLQEQINALNVFYFNLSECSAITTTPVYSITVVAENQCEGVATTNCTINLDFPFQPQQYQYILGSSKPNDMIIHDLPSSATLQADRLQFLVTKKEGAAENEAAILGTTTDGSFNFDALGAGIYCFYPVAYQQDQLDEAFLLLDAPICEFCPEQPPFFPLSAPAEFHIFLDLFNYLVGDSINVQEFKDGWAIIENILPLEWCYTVKETPAYCIEVLPNNYILTPDQPLPIAYVEEPVTVDSLHPTINTGWKTASNELRIEQATLTPDDEDPEIFSGGIALEVTGGTPPYSYIWLGPNHWESPPMPVENAAKLTDLPHGWYFVQITDSDEMQPQMTQSWYWVPSGSEDDFIRPTAITTQQPSDIALHIYPNPAAEIAYLELSASKTQVAAISLYDVNGKKVRDIGLQHTITSQKQQIPIRVSDLASGMYFVYVTTDLGMVKAFPLVH